MRVRRRRGVHVLMGTLALVAGCSTAQRAEVSGVVRDRATGRVIAGARIASTDGSLAESDADGRFHLYVHGALADVNVTARGHSPEHVAIEGLEAVVALAPVDAMWEGESDHVVGFVEETWRDAGASDASMLVPCAETSLAQAHSGIASCASMTSSSCATCHEEEALVIARGEEIGAHEGLGGGCLSCHGEVARGDARASCTRCHGASFDFVSTSSSGTTFETTSTIEVSSDTIATWARALARDRSHGAHDPRAAMH